MSARSRVDKLEARRREVERTPLTIFVQTDNFNLSDFLRKNGLPDPYRGPVRVYRWSTANEQRPAI